MLFIYKMIHKLDRMLEAAKIQPIQRKLFVLCGLGWAADMMWLVGCAIIMNELGRLWGISILLRSILPLSLMTGVLSGTFLWGYFSDKHGRIKPFKITLFISGVAGSLSAFSGDIYTLAALFYLAGIGLGGNLTVDGTFFLEHCPPSYRWLLTGMSIICTIGTFSVALVA